MNDDAIVRLRAMEPEDLDFLYAMENDKEVWDVGCTNVPYSRYVLHDYIANASNDIYADGQVRMVMEDRSGNRVGLVDVFNFDASNRRAEVSVVVMTEYRGRGLARDAVCDFLRELKEIRVPPWFASGRIGIEAQVGRVKRLCLVKPHEQTGRIYRCRQEIVVHQEKYVWR